MLLAGLAQAAEVTAGVGADVAAGVVHGGAWEARAGARQVEGDLRVDTGGFSAAIQLDARLSLAPAPVVGALVPEELDARGDVGPLWLRAGIAPGPWRIEAVDGWDTALVTWSVEDRHALPGSLLAAEVGVGRPERGIAFLGGIDLGTGLDLLGDVGGQLQAAPLLVGACGRVGEDVAFTGGVFARLDDPAVVGQAGVEVGFDSVDLAAQATGGWNAPFGGHVEAVLFPGGVAAPVARVEVLGAQPGGAVGVAVRPVKWLALKAEVSYADGAPQGWVEAAAFAEGKAKKRKGGKR